MSLVPNFNKMAVLNNPHITKLLDQENLIAQSTGKLPPMMAQNPVHR